MFALYFDNISLFNFACFIMFLSFSYAQLLSRKWYSGTVATHDVNFKFKDEFKESLFVESHLLLLFYHNKTFIVLPIFVKMFIAVVVI